MLINIGAAALAGGTYGLIAYFKNKKQEEAFVDFDTKEFLTGVVGASVIGGIAFYMGIAPDVVSTGAIGTLVFQTLRKAFKALLG